jgi:AraC-like DNA-binding protein
VAQRLGFADPFHFSRAFKSVHGVAPRALLALARTADHAAARLNKREIGVAR